MTQVEILQRGHLRVDPALHIFRQGFTENDDDIDIRALHHLPARDVFPWLIVREIVGEIARDKCAELAANVASQSDEYLLHHGLGHRQLFAADLPMHVRQGALPLPVVLAPRSRQRSELGA